MSCLAGCLKKHVVSPFVQKKAALKIHRQGFGSWLAYGKAQEEGLFLQLVRAGLAIPAFLGYLQSLRCVIVTMHPVAVKEL
jgi:hypothetical protein